MHGEAIALPCSMTRTSGVLDRVEDHGNTPKRLLVTSSASACAPRDRAGCDADCGLVLLACAGSSPSSVQDAGKEIWRRTAHSSSDSCSGVAGRPSSTLQLALRWDRRLPAAEEPARVLLHVLRLASDMLDKGLPEFFARVLLEGGVLGASRRSCCRCLAPKRAAAIDPLAASAGASTSGAACPKPLATAALICSCLRYTCWTADTRDSARRAADLGPWAPSAGAAAASPRPTPSSCSCLR
mmetsp:Transcript_68333/g.176178  ORF Transcript_68333/g.176178 Transcript_68333/m.176178 type:complete len:241 (-) Transcript_68333:375-1097(-)